MKIGVIFPQTEFGNDIAALRDYAQAAEALGYDHILAYDHVLGADPARPGGWNGPYIHTTSFHEPFVLFGFWAAVTSRVEFVTNIIILPQRQAALVAKQAAEVDVLTGGRLRLGVANGWNAVEYEALNEDFQTRGRRISEQIEVMRLLWTQQTVDFKGRWHSIPKAGINPMPVQQPIPVWFGGNSEPVMKRVAAIGDGWFPQFDPAAEASRQIMERLWQYAAESGRGPADIGTEGRVSMGNGNQDEWLKTIDDWRAIGGTHIGLNTMRAGNDSPQDHIDAIRRFMETVGQAAR